MSSPGRRQDGRRYENNGSRVGVAIRPLRTKTVLPLQLVELSPGGLKFRGLIDGGGLVEGEDVEAVITSDGPPLTLSGSVAWLRGDADVEGGLCFDSLTPEQRDRLAALVAWVQLGPCE